MYISALFYAMLEILGDGGKVHVRLAVHPVKEESLSRLISYLVVVELSVPPPGSDALTGSPNGDRVVRIIY